MIPLNLHWAFEDGHRVQTPGGYGKTKINRLADLILLSGKLCIGYPEQETNLGSTTLFLDIAPGIYPIYVTLAKHAKNSTLAFVTVRFSQTQIVSYQKFGTFFVDNGSGVICDANAIGLFTKKRLEMSREQWDDLRMQSREGGDGNLILDENTGVNAIVFRTSDWMYNCYVGLDNTNLIACLVIDGRIITSNEHPIIRIIRRVFK